MRGDISAPNRWCRCAHHRLRAGMPPASGWAAPGGVGSFDECWQRPDRWKCDPIAGDEELMVQRGGRLVAVLESAVFSSGNRWQRRIRRSETRSGASGSGGDCRGMISAPAVRKSAVELRGRRDSLSFETRGGWGCPCWHPCRDAGRHFRCEPVVSLRSTTGYVLGCLRHPDGLHRAACDGEIRAWESATGGCRFRGAMAGASDGRSVSQYLPRSEPRTLWALAPFSEIYVDLSRRCVGWIRAVLSKNRLSGIFCLMDVGAFRDGSQWHRPPRDIDWWRIARGDAETRRHGPTGADE